MRAVDFHFHDHLVVPLENNFFPQVNLISYDK